MVSNPRLEQLKKDVEGMKGISMETVPEVLRKYEGMPTYPYDTKTFYELYDEYDKVYEDFKIIPVQNRSYWIIKTGEKKNG